MPESTRKSSRVKAAPIVAAKRTSTNRGTSQSVGFRMEVQHVDDIGRKFVVYINEGEDPAFGNIKGPMPLDSLNLPQPLMVRLHNELYNRGLITTQDIMRRPQDVQGAIQAACRLDVNAIQGLYKSLGKV